MPLRPIAKILEPLAPAEVNPRRLKRSGLPYKSLDYYRQLSAIGRQARLVAIKRKRLRGIGLNPDAFADLAIAD
jgi:hypothetical protein